MKIIKEKSKYHSYAFEFEFSFEVLEFCRDLKNQFGWQSFSFFEKKWRFNDPAIIVEIKNKYKDVETEEGLVEISKEDQLKQELQKIKEQKLEAIKIDENRISTLKIPGFKGEPFNYQKLGIEFFNTTNGKAILGDEPGLGKSIQTLGYIVYNKIPKTLIVAPASVKWSWYSEVEKWTNLKAIVIDSKSNLTIKTFKENDIIIINYDILEKFFEFLSTVRFDLMVIDEFQKIKSVSAKRSKLSKNLSRNIPKVILLSGTPILNKPVELFNALNVIDQKEWNDWYKYTKRYCGGHMGYFGYESNGATNIEELREKIQKYFLRRKKINVLKELPPKINIDYPVELSPEKKFEYDLAMDSFVEYLKDIKDKTDREIQKTVQAEQITKLNELRVISTSGKIPATKELINNIIENGEKVIVFSNFNKPIEELHEEFKDISVLLTGQTPEFLRKDAIERFQKDDNIKIFFGGIVSAGVGITLTKASSVIFMDINWVPATHVQASDRAQRIGSEAEVINVYWVIAKDTIDEKMRKILEEKQKIFDKLFEDNLVEKLESTNITSDLIRDIKNNNNI